MALKTRANRYFRRITGYELRKAQRTVEPSLTHLTQAAGHLEVTATDFLQALGWGADDQRMVVGEFEDVKARLNDAYTVRASLFPPEWGVEEATGLTIYALTRLLRPKTVVETGVADGRSSFMILSALEKNGVGTLHSFDIRRDAGSLVRGHQQWKFTVNDAHNPERTLSEAVGKLESIDLFLHDSDHRYANQMFEYRLAWRKLAQQGLLASDDFHHTKAFVDFAAAIRRRPHLLFDRRKVFGAILRI